MAYNALKERTKQRQERLKQIPEDELNRMRDILNDYIVKNRKKHINFLKKSLIKRLGSILTDDLVEEMLQTLYLYAWTNIERVMEFYETGHMDRYFNTLFFHPATTKNARLLMGHDIHTEIIPDCHEYEESPTQYTNDALNPKLPLEDRLKAHSVALDETKCFLLDNPDSKLNTALKLQKKQRGQKGYEVALNYIATPSYTFLNSNCRELGIHNIQGNVDNFKRICSEVYGKKVLKNNIMPFSQF